MTEKIGGENDLTTNDGGGRTMRIDDIPKTIRDFAETKGGIEKLLRRAYGIEVCEVCGDLGIRFTSNPIITRKLATTHHGWYHSDRTPLEISGPPETYLEQLQVTLKPPSALLKHPPSRFCVSDMVSVEAARGHRLVCPKCGEFGSGESVSHGQRRFWHKSDRSCYLGSVRPPNPTTTCPKCGKDGKMFISQGYEFIRHKDGQCRVEKV